MFYIEEKVLNFTSAQEADKVKGFPIDFHWFLHHLMGFMVLCGLGERFTKIYIRFIMSLNFILLDRSLCISQIPV